MLVFILLLILNILKNYWKNASTGKSYDLFKGGAQCEILPGNRLHRLIYSFTPSRQMPKKYFKQSYEILPRPYQFTVPYHSVLVGDISLALYVK